MEHGQTDTAGRAFLWAFLKALDEHGVLTSAMIASAIRELNRAAADCRAEGDNLGFQQISDLIGQLASFSAKRNAHPNVSADIHLKSFR
jgi:hypothetical protein